MFLSFYFKLNDAIKFLLGATTISIRTLRITTFSKMVTFLHSTEHTCNITCHVSVTMPIVIEINVIMPNVILPNVIMPNVIMPNVRL
jgi:hypothetical protein